MDNHLLSSHLPMPGNPRREAGWQFRLLALLLAGTLLGVSFPREAAASPMAAVVSVVVLNEQSEPSRQGLGVVVDQQGGLLTSAALLARGRGAIIKAADGEKLVVRRILHWDFFQDVALVQVEAESLPAAPLGAPKGVRSGERVWVGIRDNPAALKEARVAGVMPFSPRLTFLKLAPGDLEADLGAPVFNGKGELVGMLHAFARDQEKSRGFQFFLARDRSHLPGLKKEQEEQEEAPEWPEQVAEDQDFRASRVFWEGVEASLRQDWAGAREKFNAALKLAAALPEALYGRGVARYNLKDYEAAAQDLQQATRAVPDYALAFLWLGRTWERQGKADAALSAYERATGADPGLSEAWFQWGTALYRRGNLAKAQECLEKAGDDFPQAAQRWWYLGNIALTQQRSEKALEAFKRARELDAGFYQAYFEEGKLLKDLGRPQEAARLLTTVVQNNPKWALARFHLALAYRLSANNAGAWEQYFALQKIEPELAMRLGNFLEQNN